MNISIQKAELDPSPAALAARLAGAFPSIASFTLRPDSDAAVHERALAAARDAGIVFFSLFVPRDRLGSAAPLLERDLALIEAIAREKPGRTLAMSYGNPYLVNRIGGVAAFAIGWGEKGWFGNQAVYFESFIGLVQGTLRPQGRLPVVVSEEYPIGAGLIG